jgi:hypothetical protein
MAKNLRPVYRSRREWARQVKGTVKMDGSFGADDYCLGRRETVQRR